MHKPAIQKFNEKENQSDGHFLRKIPHLPCPKKRVEHRHLYLKVSRSLSNFRATKRI
jgi:hypothetical protein